MTRGSIPSSGPEPYFDRPSPDPDLRPLLLVSYHFPPSQAAGALRWQKFARYAAERGYGLDVLALDPDQLGRPDPSRLDDLPAGTRVFGVTDRPLAIERAENALTRLLHGLRDRIGRGPGPRPAEASADADRGTASADDDHSSPTGQAGASESGSVLRDDLEWNLLEPGGLRRAYFAASSYARDGRWARRAARVGELLQRRVGYTAVITCGPPHMVHEAGRRLHQRFGLPFVMDLRDPWSLQGRLPEHLASPVWYALARRYERRAVDSASLIVCNTLPAAEAMEQEYPAAFGSFAAVTNGFDDLDVSDGGRPLSKFTVAYAGALYLDRDPTSLFRAAGRVVRELDLGPEEFGLQFIGQVDQFGGRGLYDLAAEAGLAPSFLTTREFMPRDRLLRELSRAAMLVSLPQDSDMSIPSKVFEYMSFPAWLLALATQESATGRLLVGTGADVVQPGDVDGIAAAVRTRFLAFRAGERPTPLARHLGQFSRRAQADRLFDALEATTIPRRALTATPSVARETGRPAR